MGIELFFDQVRIVGVVPNEVSKMLKVIEWDASKLNRDTTLVFSAYDGLSNQADALPVQNELHLAVSAYGEPTCAGYICTIETQIFNLARNRCSIVCTDFYFDVNANTGKLPLILCLATHSNLPKKR